VRESKGHLMIHRVACTVFCFHVGRQGHVASCLSVHTTNYSISSIFSISFYLYLYISLTKYIYSSISFSLFSLDLIVFILFIFFLLRHFYCMLEACKEETLSSDVMDAFSNKKKKCLYLKMKGTLDLWGL